jgi:hypothetical protein
LEGDIPTLGVHAGFSVFHSLNLEIAVGYPPFDDTRIDPEPTGVSREDVYRRLYRFVDNKLIAFLGYIGLGDPNTRFLVYSRGWDETSRRQ